MTTNKPLHSYEAERSLIIAFLTLDDAVLEAQSNVSPAEFFSVSFQNIATVCYDLFNKGKKADCVSVENELKKINSFEDLEIENNIWTLNAEIAHGTIESNGSIIRGYYKRREAIRVFQQGIQSLYNESIEPETSIEVVQTRLINIDSKNDSETKSFGELRMPTLEASKEIKEARLNGTKSALITPKIQSLKNIAIGYNKAELIILAARPAMGKTAWALDEAINAAKMGYKVLYLSYEMNQAQITGRILANLSKNTQYTAVSNGFLSKDEEVELSLVGTGIENNLFVSCSFTPTIEKARSLAIKMKIKHDIDFIIVDYLQLMSSSEIASRKSSNRDQEIGVISRTLKALTVQLDLPILALCQLSRANETRGGDKRPMLSDLRESGNLEQDADKVIFLHRPEYYGVLEYEGGVDATGITEAIVAKNRVGATGTAMADSSQIPMSRFIEITDGRFDNQNQQVF